MLKRISTKNLILGMYLHEFCGSWMEHPFWRTKFTLTDPKDLASIRATAIREVWIDVSLGQDVAPGTASTTREEVDQRIDTAFSRLQDLPAINLRDAAPPPPPAPQPQQRSLMPTRMQEELKTAAAICTQPKEAVVSMFKEARMGRAVDSASV